LRPLATSRTAFPQGRLGVRPPNLAKDTDAQDSSEHVDAERFGYDPSYPEHGETLATIQAALEAELNVNVED